MNNTIIATALKTFGMTPKDIQNIEKSQELRGKIFLKNGKGCLFLEGWTSEVRRKRQKDGTYTFFRIELEEPRWRCRRNESSWTTLVC